MPVERGMSEGRRGNTLAFLIPEIVPFMGYLFPIFWMRMVFLNPRPNFQTLFSPLNILLFDDHRLHTPIHNHLINAYYVLGKKTQRRKYA